MSALSILASGEVLATQVRWARTPSARAKGLLRGPPLRAGEAIVLEPAHQVHTFGLGYPIDVLFCDRSGKVLHIVRALRPRRVTRFVRGARYAIELPAGTIPDSLRTGDRLVLGFSEGSRPSP